MRLYFLADFGDFTHFMSQDFLREYVLFPVVSPQTSLFKYVCLCVFVCCLLAHILVFVVYLLPLPLCIPD